MGRPKPRTCIQCGISFLPERVPAGGYSRRKTCGPECQQLHRTGSFQKYCITSRTCEVCGTVFTPKRFADKRRSLSRARACSHPCRQVLRGGPVWSPAEEAHLALLVGDIPPPQLHRRYNHWAQINGYPKRQKSAVIIRAQRFGSMRPIGEWLDPGTAAVMLGIDVKTLDRWFRCGYLQAADTSTTVRYFRRQQLIELTQTRPHLFGGLDKDDLYSLLEDWDAVYSILSRYPRRPNAGRPVVNIATGQRYPNRAEAAAAIGVTKSALLRALQNGTRCRGHQWTWVDEIQRRRA